MVKLKTSGRSGGGGQQRPGRGRTARSAVAPRTQTSVAGLVIAVFGWLVVLGVLAALLLGVKTDKENMAKVGKRKPAGLVKIQEDVDLRREEISNEQKLRTKAINVLVKERETLTAKLRGVDLTVKDLDPEATALSRTHKKLVHRVTALRDDTTLTGEGAAELKAKLDELLKQRDKLKARFEHRKTRMQAGFEKAKERSEPGIIRQWYGTHHHTVFAPAAGFFAAEKAYAKRQSKDALRIYKDVLRRYPDSSYTDACRNRMNQIAARIPYQKETIGLELYVPKLAQQSDIQAPAKAPAEPAE
ncbi:MAG: hypothetical protein KAI66_07745 [Lentisphaeria bacterium]|nr:hypothetical protein [Lentisphaeria bacterium]